MLKIGKASVYKEGDKFCVKLADRLYRLDTYDQALDLTFGIFSKNSLLRTLANSGKLDLVRKAIEKGDFKGVVDVCNDATGKRTQDFQEVCSLIGELS